MTGVLLLGVAPHQRTRPATQPPSHRAGGGAGRRCTVFTRPGGLAGALLLGSSGRGFGAGIRLVAGKGVAVFLGAVGGYGCGGSMGVGGGMGLGVGRYGCGGSYGRDGGMGVGVDMDVVMGLGVGTGVSVGVGVGVRVGLGMGMSIGWLLVAGRAWLVVAGWWLVAGGWWFGWVVGRWRAVVQMRQCPCAARL